MVPTSGARRRNRFSRVHHKCDGSLFASASLLLAAIRQSGSRNVVDLCSGGGGPWLSSAWRAARSNGEWPLTVLLTDKFPSTVLRSRLTKSDDSLRMVSEPVDATAVPSELHGFRTIFASFHHFRDDAAVWLLKDAVSAREGIATAEVTSRTFKALAVILLMPWACLLMTPFMRPFRISRLLLTYLIPLIPFTFCGTAWSPALERALQRN